MKKIDYGKADIILFSPGELKVALKVLEKLKSDIKRNREIYIR